MQFNLRSLRKWTIVLSTIFIFLILFAVLRQTGFFKNTAKLFYNWNDLKLLKELSDANQLPLNDQRIGTVWQKTRLTSLLLKDIAKVPDSLSGLTALTDLQLTGVVLTEYPDAISNLKNLHTLSIRNTGIKELPETIGKLVVLTSLSIMSNDSLERIDNDLNALSNLEYLSISENESLQALPLSFSRLAKMKKLFIRQDTIDSFPEGIEAMMQLIVLELFLNTETSEHTTIPTGITSLTKLTRLALSGNFAAFPEKIDSLTEIKELYLYGLNLPSLPAAVYDLQHCEELDIISCRLKSMPEGIARMKELRTLLLNGNHLTTLPADIYTINGELVVDVENNALKDITPRQDAWLKKHAGEDWRSHQRL